MELHIENNDLFIDHPDVIAKDEAGVISPKYISQYYTSLLYKMGLTFAQSRLIYALITMLFMTFAITNICFRLKLKKPIACILFFIVGLPNCSVFSGVGGFGLSIWPLGNTPQLSLTFGWLAISFCFGERKRWNVALIISAFACTIHAHEGLCSITSILIFWTAYCIKNKKIDYTICKGLLLWTIVASVTILPNLLTDINMFSKETYFTDYMLYRYPHHIDPTTFPIARIFTQILILIFCCILIKTGINCKETTLLAFLTAFSFVISLFTMYMFTNIYPVEIVPKLFLSKYFRYVAFIFMVMLMIYFDKNLVLKNTIIIIILCILSCVYSGMLYFAPPLIFFETSLRINLEKKYYQQDYAIKLHWRWFFLIFLLFAFCVFFNLRPISVIHMNIYESLVITIGIILHLIFNNKIVCSKYEKSSSICILTTLLFCLILPSQLSFTNNNITVKGPEYWLEKHMGADAYRICHKFKEMTPANAGLLLDPFKHKEFIFIEIVSLRNVYVTKSATPATSYGAYEWRKRLEKVGLTPGQFNRKTPEQMYALLNDIGYDYVLFLNPSGAYNNSSKFKKVLQEGPYVIYQKI
jgi:hypothetical protein